jgi:hypothetical protein
MIVTETSLGPALTKSPTKKELTELLRDGDKLEVEFFTNMLEMCPNTPIVCTFPVYITRDGEKNYLPKALDKIEKFGYRLTCIDNKFMKTTERHSLLYLRPDQFVGREILCFLPPKSS